jgi:sulfoxide reductase heme-binding subunit YedZ
VKRRRLAQAALVAVCLLPLAGLAVGALRDTLGANPIERVTHVTGEWSLRLLVATLAVTPLRQLFGWPQLAPFRRTLGLLAFTYVCLHLLTYVALDLALEWEFLIEDVLERPYITAGFTAFLCLLPLAVTSTRAWMRRLGRRWVHLHRLVYVAAIAAVIHYLWGVKADVREPLIYIAIVAALLLVRVWLSWRPRGRAARQS